MNTSFSFIYEDISKNTWGDDVNIAWPLTCKTSCLKKIELRPLISGFDFALLEVRNLCVASRLFRPSNPPLTLVTLKIQYFYSLILLTT